MMNDYLKLKEFYHSGVLGMKWGVRKDSVNGKAKQQYAKEDIVFVSGKIKYDQPINDIIKVELNSAIAANSKIIVGDAPGSDKRVQDYLKEKNYNNVQVYTSDSEVRNNVGEWPVMKVEPWKIFGQKEARHLKDIVMTKLATKAIAIMPENDRPDSAMSNNINRLKSKGLKPVIFDYEKFK